MQTLDTELNEGMEHELQLLDAILKILFQTKKEELDYKYLYNRTNELINISTKKFEIALSFLVKNDLLSCDKDYYKITYDGILKLSEGGFVSVYKAHIQKNEIFKSSQKTHEKVQKLNIINGKLWFPYSIIVLLVTIIGILLSQRKTDSPSNNSTFQDSCIEKSTDSLMNSNEFNCIENDSITIK